MAQWQYVMSGLSHLRYAQFMSDSYKKPVDKDYILDVLNELFGIHNDIGFLFNAWVEAKMGKEIFTDMYSFAENKLYSDSGGLQIITRGMEITDELKQKIYGVQSNYSNFGMCFDEIPVITDGAVHRTSTAGKVYDSLNLEKYAAATADNVIEQIKYYLANDNNVCKPFLIIHGNSYDDYIKWYKICITRIMQYDRSFINHISGLAMGGGGLGQGDNVSLNKSVFIRSVCKDWNHIHLLGVGSISKISPYIIFDRNGYYPDDLLISYDSTSHSQYINMGSYYNEKCQRVYLRNAYKRFIELFEIHLGEFCSKHDIDYESMIHKTISANPTVLISDTNVMQNNNAILYHTLYTILNIIIFKQSLKTERITRMACMSLLDSYLKTDPNRDMKTLIQEIGHHFPKKNIKDVRDINTLDDLL